MQRLTFRLRAIPIPRWLGPLGVGVGSVGPLGCATEGGYHSCCPPRVSAGSFPEEKVPLLDASRVLQETVCHKNLLVHSGITPAFPAPFLLLPSHAAPDPLGLSLPSEGKIRSFLF